MTKAATIHAQYSTKVGIAACRTNQRGMDTTADPDVITCKSTACKAEAELMRSAARLNAERGSK